MKRLPPNDIIKLELFDAHFYYAVIMLAAVLQYNRTGHWLSSGAQCRPTWTTLRLGRTTCETKSSHVHLLSSSKILLISSFERFVMTSIQLAGICL